MGSYWGRIKYHGGAGIEDKNNKKQQMYAINFLLKNVNNFVDLTPNQLFKRRYMHEYSLKRITYS